MFNFPELALGLRDRRVRPQIPTLNVWLSVFAMFALRLRSLNALEQELRQRGRWESFVGNRKPSADTIGRVLSQFSLDQLRAFLLTINRTSWRNKAIHPRAGESYRVVAVDGHEMWASRARCCNRCLIREVKAGDKKIKEYYHRVVVAQWAGVTPPPILDLEVVNPNEGEVVAARRLMNRVLANYSRLVDVITADALYLEAPFIRMLLDAGKHFVVVMKQEHRDLFKDADRLRALISPVQIKDGNCTTTLWDISDLTSFGTLGEKVRVVWAEEQTLRNRFIAGHRQQVVVCNTWVWVTDLAASSVPARKIQLWGHDRWDLENRGFNELANLWHMDHCFVHNTTAIEALLLTLAIAFVTTYLFYERNLKSAARVHLTRLALAGRFFDSLIEPSREMIWPALDRPG